MAIERQQEVHLAESKMNSLPKCSPKKGKTAFLRLQYILLGEMEMLKGFTIILEQIIRQL